MALNWKKIAMVLGFITVVILLGFGLYYLFLRPVPPPTININQNGNVNGTLPGENVDGGGTVIINQNTGLPDSSNTNINESLPVAPGDTTTSETQSRTNTRRDQLTQEPVQSITLSSDGSGVIYYDRTTGKFYEMSPGGRSTELNDQIFFDVENVTWSSDTTKAILEYPDGANILYNFETDKQVTLPRHWEDFSFSATGQEIIFKSMGQSEETRWLAIANADGSQAQKIEHIGYQDETVHSLWSPAGNIVAMYREDVDFDRQDLLFLGRNNENFQGTVIDGRGFRPQWSPEGNVLLYSVYSSASGYRPTLWAVEAQGDRIGQNRRNLRIQTWVDKCTFGSNTVIYCAVPRGLDEQSGIFYNELDNKPTDIYKIDLNSGISNLLASPEGNPNINKMIISENQQYLYYTTKEDGRLYKVDL